MQIDTVLFDLDGVILDSERIYKKCWEESAKELGFNLSEKTILDLRSCDSTLARVLVDEDTGVGGAYDLIRSRRKTLMSDYLKDNSFNVKDGVVDLLNKLSEMSIKKIIVTAAPPEEKIPILESVGVYPLIDSIVSVKDVKRNKPYPDIYEFACRSIGVKSDRCLAIEDAPNGVKSAYIAGLKVIMVPDLSEPDEQLRQMCYAVVNRIDEVYNLMF